MNEHTCPPVCTTQSYAYAHWLDASPKHAFLTAALTTLVCVDASFIEGWVCIEWEGHLLIWEHAWCQTPTGLLDPTLAVFQDTFPLLGYHPGARYDQPTLWHRWQAGATFPLTRSSAGEGEPSVPLSYAEAFTAASAQARSWRKTHTERSLPPSICILVANEQCFVLTAQEQHTLMAHLASWQEVIPHSERAELDVDASLRCSLVVRARAGACYANSALCACMRTRRMGQETMYIEGWLLCETEQHLELVEHAWCEHEGGIIEPTLPFLVMGGTERLHFFAGARLSCEMMETTLMQHGLPWVKHSGCFGTDGFQHQGYRDAFDQALATAVTRKRETEKPILLARSSRSEHAAISQITVEDETSQF